MIIRFQATSAATSVAASGTIGQSVSTPLVPLGGYRTRVNSISVFVTPVDLLSQLSIVSYSLVVQMLNNSGVILDAEVFPNMPDIRQTFPQLTAGVAANAVLRSASHAQLTDRIYLFGEQAALTGGQMTQIQGVFQLTVHNADGAAAHSFTPLAIFEFEQLKL